MTLRACLLLTVLSLPVALSAATRSAVGSYLETFETAQFKDPVNTTILWDTEAGELRFRPFDPIEVGRFDQTDEFELDGGYAYIAYRASLLIVDVSDPTNPTLISTLSLGNNVYDVDVRGGYAYLANGLNGLSVVDVRDPLVPTQVGQVVLSNTRGVAVAGSYAYVVARHRLEVIDILDPANPRKRGGVDIWAARRVAVDAPFVYVADYVGGLHVIDATSPSSPIVLDSYDTNGVGQDLFVRGSTVYFVDGIGLRVFDVTDRSSIFLIGTFRPGSSHTAVTVAGSYLYVGSSFTYSCPEDCPPNPGGVSVMSIAQPQTPTPVTDYFINEEVDDVEVDGRFAYLATGDLIVVEIAEPVAPMPAAGLATTGAANKVAVAGDYAYVAETNGVQIIDITDPMNPVPVANVTTTAPARDIVIVDGVAYVGHDAGLSILDIGTPAAPVVLGTYALNDPVLGVAVQGRYAYLANAGSGLSVLDVTTPSEPVLIRNMGTGGNVLGITVSGYRAFLAVEGLGLMIMDISTPWAPAITAIHPAGGSPVDIAVLGNHAFVAGQTSGLHVLDVSDGSSPVLLADYPMSSGARDVLIEGDVALVAGQADGLHLVDVSDPTNPMLIGKTNTPGTAVGVAIFGDHALVADQSSGIQVIEVYQRRFNTRRNVAQSSVIDDSDEAIEQVRVSTRQSGLIRWEVSADGGSHWQEVPPDDSWHTLAFPGSELLWRSRHFYASGGVNSTCETLQIEWRALPVEPPALLLDQNYPNPFKPMTTIRFGVSESGPLKIAIYDTQGKLVRVLLDEWKATGTDEIEWDGADGAGQLVASGVYYYRMIAGDRRLTRKMVLVR